MKIIKPKVEILTNLNESEMNKYIEKIGRVCYKSEDKITDDSAEKFIRMIIKSGHHSVLEHIYVTVKFITDRGISHEIVRHRIASYSQESTRYCNYNKDKFDNQISVIKPYEIKKDTIGYTLWYNSCIQAEKYYNYLIQNNYSPQNARAILPTCLKTELIMTANIREWRHFIKLRMNKSAHPDIRFLTMELLSKFKTQIPNFFYDIDLQ